MRNNLLYCILPISKGPSEDGSEADDDADGNANDDNGNVTNEHIYHFSCVLMF